MTTGVSSLRVSKGCPSYAEAALPYGQATDTCPTFSLTHFFCLVIVMLKLTLTTLHRMLFIVSLVLLSAGTGMAATLTVTNLNDSGAGSLRATIAAAASGDTINFAVTGTITLASELAIDKNLTIQGPGANLLTISGNNAVRVFNIGNVTPAINVTLADLTIANGLAPINSGGGGIVNLSTGTVNVTNSMLSGNSATGGGGIYNASTGTMNVTNSTLSSNSAGFGGGILNKVGTVNVTNSTLSGNSANSNGGGIFNTTGTVNVTNSTLSGNSANFGGGIDNSGTVNVTNSTLSANSANFGGGIFNSGTVNVTNSTLSGNSATSNGGGIRNTGTANVKSAIIAGNTASVGPDVSLTFTSQGFNLIGKSDGSTGFTNGVNNDQVGTIATPINPLLGPLANNGGPTMTLALLPGSPAIDKGMNTALTTDQRGFARTVDQPLIPNASDGTDIGAFEVAAAPFMPPSDQKPGSLLVFPFYKHDAQNKVDTRLTITNLGKLPINVHFLFLDGATCSEFDQFVCFTPNASITWKASEFDPQNKGYVIAYTTDNMGRPIAYNGLIGNGFVNDGEYVGNYGAESFASTLPVGAPLGAVATPGLSWTIPFDGIALDMTPTTFAVDIQSPVDTVNQKIVLAGLTGDAYAGKLSGVTQVGTGLAYNGHEALRSFSPFISGQCFVEKIIDGTNPKVTGQLSNLIPKGEVGTLRFSVTAAVGLLMTSNKNTFAGIRTLHKVQVVKSTIIIPLLMPDCQYWVNQQ